jgi:hypothetical protein
MDYRTRLLTVARAYCKATGLSMARVATLIHNQGAFFKRLEEGAGCTVDTYEKCLQWFSDRWPDTTAWPAGIMRPVANMAPAQPRRRKVRAA